MPAGHKLADPTHRREGQPDERPIFVLDPEQFARIEELLLPGYECAVLMLADMQRQQEAATKREAEYQAQMVERPPAPVSNEPESDAKASEPAAQVPEPPAPPPPPAPEPQPEPEPAPGTPKV